MLKGNKHDIDICYVHTTSDIKSFIFSEIIRRQEYKSIKTKLKYIYETALIFDCFCPRLTKYADGASLCWIENKFSINFKIFNNSDKLITIINKELYHTEYSTIIIYNTFTKAIEDSDNV